VCRMENGQLTNRECSALTCVEQSILSITSSRTATCTADKFLIEFFSNKLQVLNSFQTCFLNFECQELGSVGLLQCCMQRLQLKQLPVTLNLSVLNE